MMARVAVIDDDVVFLDLMTELASDSGWGIVTCSREDEVLPAIQREHPDLIVLDVRMAGKESGWRLLESVQRSGDTANIPIIVCSAALDELRDREQWLAERHVGILAKPFDLDDFCNRVEAALTMPLAPVSASSSSIGSLLQNG